MPVYAKKLSPQWRKVFSDFEKMTGFEVMHQDEIDAGEMTPREAWDENVRWFGLLAADVQNIRTPPEIK